MGKKGKKGAPFEPTSEFVEEENRRLEELGKAAFETWSILFNADYTPDFDGLSRRQRFNWGSVAVSVMAAVQRYEDENPGQETDD